ncbi:MAG TPA: GNAT family N-acetyltransferase [Trebonia sp.]|nr:GNAT family N-acetyltransferase [Trebonia sp.]
MDGTVIRAARIADAAQIAVVHVRSWQGAYRGLLPQAYLDGLDPALRVGQWEHMLAAADSVRTGVFVAEAGRNLLGFVGYSPSRDDHADPDRVGEIDAIYLLPSAWGKRVGGRLVAAALTRLAEAKFDQVTLWVLDVNVRACRFYEASGWSPDGAHKLDESRGFPITEVRYRISLGIVRD